MTDSILVDSVPTQTPKKSNKVLFVLVALCVVASIVAFMAYKKSRVLGDSSIETDRAKIEQVVLKVDKIIALPQGEIPTLATVTDTKPLEKQPFFEKAKVGDQVLLYAEAGKAFLYDPKANMIVEVASLDIGKK